MPCPFTCSEFSAEDARSSQTTGAIFSSRSTLAERFTAERKKNNQNPQGLCKEPSDGRQQPTHMDLIQGFRSPGLAFAGFPLGLFVSCCCILATWTPSCFHRKDRDQNCQWCFSSHSALFRLQAPAADAKEQPREGAPASSRFPLLQAWMQCRKTACSTSQPCARLPLPRYLQLPLPPAVTQAVQGRAFSLRCLAQSGGGKAGGRGGEREMGG